MQTTPHKATPIYHASRLVIINSVPATVPQPRDTAPDIDRDTGSSSVVRMVGDSEMSSEVGKKSRIGDMGE